MSIGRASAAWDARLAAGPDEGMSVEVPCGVVMGDADDLLAEHLAGCGRCADAVTADE